MKSNACAIKCKITCTIMFAALLAGCATSPFDTGGRKPAELGPGQALEQPGSTGASVIWGGRIVGIVNTGDATELEVLALPLGPGDRPRRDADGGARFVIRHPGFLEPMTYAPGRFVTAFGRFAGVESRSVGAFPLDHAVLEAEQIELWPVEPNSSRTNLNLGFGVSF
ncbi:MAG: Slp family lipoprotein [Wenzhouxiangellaceae bacterium]